MAFTYTRKINYYETDMMGVVHHSNYIRFLEEARCAWLEYVGIPMKKKKKRGYTIPTLEVNVKYKKHVTQGDILAIGIRVTEYNGIKMRIDYDVKNVNAGEVVVEAYTTHCFTTLQLKPINMKKYDEEIYTKFASAHMSKE